jgi:hypothetical protein
VVVIGYVREWGCVCLENVDSEACAYRPSSRGRKPFGAVRGMQWPVGA